MKTLHELIIKGFVMDDERLKQGKPAYVRISQMTNVIRPYLEALA